jgi:hypothetical protein
MTGDELAAKLCQEIKALVTPHLRSHPVATVASMFAAWMEVLEEEARRLGSLCPRCGQERRCKRRLAAPMRIELLGAEVILPKLYLECGHCGAPGVSIIRLLTDLGDGAASVELELAAAYCASQHSYGKASRDLEVHHGTKVERTAVRRMAMTVEAFAVAWVETERQAALARVSGEARTVGAAELMLQGDGGTVRTGRLVPCVRGDEAHGKKSRKRGLPRRKRLTEKREVITLDVRVPGTMTATALDLLVPVLSPPGERERRMLALAARAGLGDNTQVLGLGDLGSELPQAFDEAFAGYDAFYSADWQHQRKYVKEAAAILADLDAGRWERSMRDAIWKRDARRRDALFKKAAEHRVAELKARGVDFVSARAEAQVRDRTKARFCVPGAWRVENLEPKATLRAIIADGRWVSFRRAWLANRRATFASQLEKRLMQAVTEGRLTPAAANAFRGVEGGVSTSHEEARKAAA